MPNSDNQYGTFNKKTQILSQIDDGSTALQNFANVDEAKSWFLTSPALAVFDECCTGLQWSVVDNQKLKYTMVFGTKGGNTPKDDDWAGQYRIRMSTLQSTPLKSFSISNVTQDSGGAPEGNWDITVTAVGHNFQPGEMVEITGVQGMTQINDDPTKVLTVDGDTFTVLGLTHSYPAYTSGGTVKTIIDQWSNNPHTMEDLDSHLF
jgi:hypothetical protein